MWELWMLLRIFLMGLLIMVENFMVIGFWRI